MLSLFWLSPIVFTLLFHSKKKKASNEKIYKILHILTNILIIFCFLWVVITWIAEYRTIANRGVDAGGAVMFVIAFLPTIILAVAAIGGKRILDKLDLQPQKENLEIHPNCTAEVKDGKVHLSFTLDLAQPNT